MHASTEKGGRHKKVGRHKCLLLGSLLKCWKEASYAITCDWQGLVAKTKQRAWIRGSYPAHHSSPQVAQQSTISGRRAGRVFPLVCLTSLPYPGLGRAPWGLVLWSGRWRITCRRPMTGRTKRLCVRTVSLLHKDLNTPPLLYKTLLLLPLHPPTPLPSLIMSVWAIEAGYLHEGEADRHTCEYLCVCVCVKYMTYISIYLYMHILPTILMSLY